MEADRQSKPGSMNFPENYPAFMVGATMGTPDTSRPKTEAFGDSALIVKLAILADTGLLGDPETTRQTLLNELTRALDAGEVPEDFRELLP